MIRRRLLPLVILVSTSLFLWGCLGRAWPISVLSIETVLNEDNSGSNTFVLVVPHGCELLELGPALTELDDEAGVSFYFSPYRDDKYVGFQLTHVFSRPEEIPGQIARLKRAIWEPLADAYPLATDPGESMHYPQVDIDDYGVHDRNELSIDIKPVAETLAGRAWEVEIRINPVLLAGLAESSDPSQSCTTPHMTYELTMPGEITSLSEDLDTDVKTPDLFSDLARHVDVTRIKSNAVQWRIPLDFLEEGAASEISDEELLEMIYGFSGPVLILTAKSTTPGYLFRVLPRVIAPIVLLVGSAVAVIAAMARTRQTVKTRPGNMGYVRRQLDETRENLRVIQVRKSQYVMETEIPLQLIREEQRLLERIEEWEQRIVELEQSRSDEE
jgi:hypothetical protein